MLPVTMFHDVATCVLSQIRSVPPILQSLGSFVIEYAQLVALPTYKWQLRGWSACRCHHSLSSVHTFSHALSPPASPPSRALTHPHARVRSHLPSFVLFPRAPHRVPHMAGGLWTTEPIDRLQQKLRRRDANGIAHVRQRAGRQPCRRLRSFPGHVSAVPVRSARAIDAVADSAIHPDANLRPADGHAAAGAHVLAVQIPAGDGRAPPRP